MFTTEVWLTPLILLPGVALLTVSTAHRFGQVQALWRPEALWGVGGLTIAGIAAIMFAAVQLLHESLLSLHIVREQSAAIEESLKNRNRVA